MKIIKIVLCILFCFCSFVQAEVFITEGFEDGVFSTTPEGYIGSDGYCQTGTVCSTLSGNCTNCNGDNVSTIQSAVKHSGSYALKGTFLDAEAASFKTIPSYYGTSLPTKFYVRFYIYFDSDFKFYSGGGPKVFDRSGNFYLTMRGVSGTAAHTTATPTANTSYAVIGIYSSDQGSKTVCGSVESDFAIISAKRECDHSDGADWVIDLTNADHVGWWCFEVMLDLSNDLFSVWVKRPTDSSATQIYDDMAWNFNTNRDEIHWLWMNNAGSGIGGGDYYLDDIVVADSYIGLTDESSTATMKGISGYINAK